MRLLTDGVKLKGRQMARAKSVETAIHLKGPLGVESFL
jgi:hypothetical protein